MAKVKTLSQTDQVMQAFTKLAYLQGIIKDVANTTKHDKVTIMSMTLDPNESLVSKLISELCNAAKRGVTVRLLIDAYSLIIGKHSLPGPLFYSKDYRSVALFQFTDLRETLGQLNAAGVQITLTNIPKHRFSNPFANRSHAKFAVINNRVYVGGCNLDEPSDIDSMICFTNAPKLTSQLQAYAAQKHHPMHRIRLSKASLSSPVSMQLLFDVNGSKQSRIIQAALKLIDEAKQSIFLTSMFPQTGKVLEHLRRAAVRGVTVEVVANAPEAHGFPYSLYHRWLQRHWQKGTAAIRYQELSKHAPLLHGKLLASEHECLIGSHNLVDLGVQLGAEELSVLIYDSASSQFITDFYKQLTRPYLSNDA